ncbi:MAG: hypothetical protein AB2A00_27690 [Myxococcota bacterium]
MSQSTGGHSPPPLEELVPPDEELDTSPLELLVDPLLPLDDDDDDDEASPLLELLASPLDDDDAELVDAPPLDELLVSPPGVPVGPHAANTAASATALQRPISFMPIRMDSSLAAASQRVAWGNL